MTARPASISIVLATDDVGDLSRAVALARAAQRRRATTTLFAMHRGVIALAARPDLTAALVEAGCDLIGCATSAAAHAVDLVALGAEIGSQDDHARLAAGTRVMAFT